MREGDDKAAFVAKLSDAETEAAETQVRNEIALRCNYINAATRERLHAQCDQIIGEIVQMIDQADKRLIRSRNV